MPTSTALGDFLTAEKNIVTAVNNAAQNYLNVNGASVATALTAATVVKSSAGRVCTVIVVVAGSTTGTVRDATSTTATTGAIFTIPNTAGIYVLNCPTLYGLTIQPGTGQTVTVSFS